jgi:hypothetical protein
MRITAAQYVSGVLTSKESPRGQGGYQTILATSDGLTKAEIRILDSRVKYGSMQGRKAKWQYYRLPGQRPVISRLIPIPEPDEAGRGGRYFAHSLIFSASDWRQLDDAPFDLLRPDNFFSSLAQILSLDDLTTGNVPVRRIETGIEWLKESTNLILKWSGEQLNHLLMLVSDPQQLTEHGDYVALIGSELQILDALKVVFLLASSSVRKSCSFDTNALGCEWQSDAAFWGRGFSLEREVGTRFVIDAVQRQVKLPEASTLRANGFLPEQLSSTLRHAILARLNPLPQKLRGSLINRYYDQLIGESIYHSLLQDSDLPLTSSDLELVNSLGKIHRSLGLLLALRSDNERQRLNMLTAMSQVEYNQRIGELKTRPDFKAWQVFSPIHIPAWFDFCRGFYNLDDITRAISGVAEHGSRQDRQQLEYLGKCLTPDQRQQLRLWLKSSSYRLSHLQAALDKSDNAREAGRSTKASSSLWRRLRHLFTKQSKRA